MRSGKLKVSGRVAKMDLLVAGALALCAGCMSGDGLEGVRSFDDVLAADSESVDVAVLAEIDFTAEERVKLCMADQGWEYRVAPFDPQTYERPVGGELPPAEYALEYGFGLHLVLEDLVLGGAPLSSDDVNAPVLADLAAGAQEAWFAGVRSCHERVGVDSELRDEIFGQLAEIDREIADLVHADDRVLRARRDWVSCMSEAGYEYESEELLTQELIGEMSQLGRTFTEMGSTSDTRSEASPEFREAVALFREHEIQLAVTNEMCVRDVRALEALVRDEVEVAYFQDNRSEIADWIENFELATDAQR